MSNKPNYAKKNKGVQIGNFIVENLKGKFKSVRISSIAENWHIQYREDSFLYIWINEQLKTEEGKGILHLAISAWYASTNGVPDEQFLTEIVNSYTESVKRMKEDVSPEEDQTIIDEMREDVE